MQMKTSGNNLKRELFMRRKCCVFSNECIIEIWTIKRLEERDIWTDGAFNFKLCQMLNKMFLCKRWIATAVYKAVSEMAMKAAFMTCLIQTIVVK